MDLFKKIAKISLRNLSSDLHINEDLIIGIHDEENSWSFISKLAQLIEGFFTNILVQRLDEQNTYDTISNLSQAVRLNLAYDLELISKEQKFMFLTIAEIRNNYIHKLSNVEVSLSEHLQTLKEDRQKEIYKRFKPFILDEEITSQDHFYRNCINAIFSACIIEINKIHGCIEGYVANRKHARFRAQQAEKLLPKKADNRMYMEDRIMVHDFIPKAKEALKKV